MVRLIFTVLALLLAPVASTGVFKWTDENGKVHYGSRPGSDTAEAIEIEPAPGLPADHARRQEKRRRLLNLYDEERAEKQEAEALAEKQEQIRTANCQRARDYYKTIKTASALYDVDDNGDSIILDADSRQAEVNRIMEYMDEWCD